MTPIPGTAGYGAHAAALADPYESITFEEVHRVLDIGAGSGRDAAALAQQGHTVTGRAAVHWSFVVLRRAAR